MILMTKIMVVVMLMTKIMVVVRLMTKMTMMLMIKMFRSWMSTKIARLREFPF